MSVLSEQPITQPVNLSREALYAQVWAIPMSRLAVRYNVSGRGLAKICARLKIPCPPRGYWARKAAGQKVVQYRLGEPDADTPPNITFTPAPPPRQPSPAETEMWTRLEGARAATGVTVPATLSRPHPVIAGWLAEHKRARQEGARSIWGAPPSPLSETDHRRHRILDTLFKALEAKGAKVKQEESPARVYLEVQKERIDFQLREKQRQIRRPLTDSESKYSFMKDRGWAQELKPTGMLVFTIKTWLPAGLRQEWKDEAKKPLENDLPDIVATLELAGPALAKERYDRADAERRRWQEEHRRYLERQRREQDEKRWQRFLKIAHRCDQAASARRLLVELAARPTSDDITIGGHPASEWLAWATDWLERYDPLKLKAEELYEALVNV